MSGRRADYIEVFGLRLTPPSRWRRRRGTVAEEITRLDPVADHERIVHLLVSHEYPWDMTRALEIALYRTYCSPRISGLLRRTGSFEQAGQKRYDDTAILIGEFLRHGHSSSRGRRAIAQMNRMHDAFEIRNEDFLFVLTTFVLDPIAWMARFAWRPFTRAEETALLTFWQRVGEAMAIEDIPASLDEWRRFSDDYQKREFRPHSANTAIGEATIAIVRGWLPGVLHPFVRPVVASMLDGNMRRAFGFSPPPPPLPTLIEASLRLRGRLTALVDQYPDGVDHIAIGDRTHPHGYLIEEIGPPELVERTRGY